MKRRPTGQFGLDLPETGRAWPSSERFPHNSEGHKVGEQVVEDLATSVRPLIIAGYASLERLLALIDELRRSQWVTRPEARARFLIGVEPKLRPDLRLPLHVGAVEQEIADYWLAQGISISQWRALLVAIELIDQGRLHVKYSGERRNHAKIFVGEYAATLGSSNFTD